MFYRLPRAILGHLALVATAGCGGVPQIVPLLRTSGPPIVSPLADTTPLEVVSRSDGVPDPLPVRGSEIVYGDLESALGIAVSTATAPWAAAHRDHPVAKNGGWSVLVEITAADALLEPGGRLVVNLGVRATLRTRSGNAYLGQTQSGCREGGLVSPDQGAPVVYRCMTRLGRELAGWLAGGVNLDPPPPEQG